MNFDPDALQQNDDVDDGEDIHAGLPWNHCGRFDGLPGMVWYATVRKARGDQLQIGDWLDALDHSGARVICGLWAGGINTADLPAAMADFARQPELDSKIRTVMFSEGDTETVRCDVEYDVVDPDSQVTPDGTPVVTD